MVVVDKVAERHASTHDLRRSFATRWSKRVMPAVLQRLMRHADISTTMKYYVSATADELVDQLWTDHRAAEKAQPAPGNISGNNAPETEEAQK